MAGLNQNFSARRKEMLIYCFGRLTGRSIEGLFLKPHIRGRMRDSPKYFKTLFHGNKLPHIRGREKHAPRQAHSFSNLTYGGACVIPHTRHILPLLNELNKFFKSRSSLLKLCIITMTNHFTRMCITPTSKFFLLSLQASSWYISCRPFAYYHYKVQQHPKRQQFQHLVLCNQSSGMGAPK